MKLKNPNGHLTPKMMRRGLCVAVSALLSSVSVEAAPSSTDISSSKIEPPKVHRNIGDLEIYQSAEGGKVTIMMMLDTSGSMSGELMTDGSACELENTHYTLITRQSNTIPQYTRYLCHTHTTAGKRYQFYAKKQGNWWSGYYTTYHRCLDDHCNSISSQSYDVKNRLSQYSVENRGSDKLYYTPLKPHYRDEQIPDRMTRLKDAIFTLLDKDSAGNYLLDSHKVAIGIGQFSSQSDENNQFNYTDGQTGKILVPAASLSEEQRKKIKEEVAKLRAEHRTPTANAYAEAGAYMMGTTTWVGYTNIYGYTVPPQSGFEKSHKSTKSNGKYISPLKNANSCDGQGIYFLTDGEPNGADPYEIMNKALEGNGHKIPNYPKDINSFTYGSISPGNETLPFGSSNGNAMPSVGAFAKALRDVDKNPSRKSIRTAVVGFGSVFDVNKYNGIILKDLQSPKLDPKTSLPIQSNGKYEYHQDKKSDYINCNLISNVDAKNACNWGAKSHPSLPKDVGGYGEGGFYSAQSTDDIIKSVRTFLSDLNNEIAASPSGILTVPKDPYKTIGELPYAFMPLVEARVGGGNGHSNIWPGNVKKYKLYDGTLQGQNGDNIFTNVAGSLNADAADLWTSSSSANGARHDSVRVGGLYGNLKTPNHPNNTDNIRTLYLEDLTAQGQQTTTFRKITVDWFSGKVTGLDELIDTTTYTPKNKLILLQFLGFERAAYTKNGREQYTKYLSDMYDIPNIKMSDLVLKKAASPNKVLGATIHSKPISISYGANLDDHGRIKDTERDDYVFFGSMDGTLHLVNAKNHSGGNNIDGGGTENVVILPRIMMQQQPEALIPESTYIDRLAGTPKFGIDGHWAVKNKYSYNYSEKKVKSDGKVLAYGGMRLGGEGLLALDITNKNEPKKGFSNQNSALIDKTTPGFERIGHIWNQPTLARIKTSQTDTKGTDVIVFGGGYDMCYEYDNFQVGVSGIGQSVGRHQANQNQQCNNKSIAQGNAIYIVNADTGQLLWSASNQSNTKKTPSKTHSDLKHSIVGGVAALDRNSDGIADHLYFGDLGGQLFRVDFKDGNITSSSITKLLKNEYTGNTIKYTRRFYEMPVVSIHKNPHNNQLFAMVNIISGDRSSPLSKMRADNQYADRVYGIIDTDVTRVDLFTKSATNGNQSMSMIKELGDNDLIDFSKENKNNGNYSQQAKKKIIEQMQKQVKKGWYYPLTRFDGWANVRYGKGFGKSDILANKLYTSVYNPDMNYSAVNSCNARIVGGTERQIYCLPYGVCLENESRNGTAGFIRAGQGIQELSFGSFTSKDNITRRTLINTLSLTEQLKENNRVNFGSDNSKKLIRPNQGAPHQDTPNSHIGLLASNFGDAGGQSQSQNTQLASQLSGDGTGSIDLVSERYILQPRQWY
ncbi:hypothetical protein B0682_08945, partial [Moraxella lincolnii]